MLKIVIMFTVSIAKSILDSQTTHLNQTHTHTEDTSHYVAVYIPVKVVLVMGGGLHMGDLLSWGKQTHTLRHFLSKAIQLVVYV